MDFLRVILKKITSRTERLVACPFCKAHFAEKLELVIHVRKNMKPTSCLMFAKSVLEQRIAPII